MTTIQLDWICTLTYFFLSMYFSSVFSLLDKTLQWFLLSWRVETTHSWEWSACTCWSECRSASPVPAVCPYRPTLSPSGPKFSPLFHQGPLLRLVELWQLYEVGGIISPFFKWGYWSLETLLFPRSGHTPLLGIRNWKMNLILLEKFSYRHTIENEFLVEKLYFYFIVGKNREEVCFPAGEGSNFLWRMYKAEVSHEVTEKRYWVC